MKFIKVRPGQKKTKSRQRILRNRGFFGVFILIILGGYWFLPIRGKILIIPDPAQNYVGVWPRLQLDPQAARSGDYVTLSLGDNVPWSGVKVLVDNTEAQLLNGSSSTNGIWTWQWRFSVPAKASYVAIFYHDCQTGCIQRALFTLGSPNLSPVVSQHIPTKLGVVFPDIGRDWHGRAGWAVELLYVEQPNDPDFSIDPVAQRVQREIAAGIRVLLRIDYDHGQTFPPGEDRAALTTYLAYCSRLARDDRFRDVYAYFFGSGYNTRGGNSLGPDHLVTPEWYTRVFNGYGVGINQTDNIVQTMRGINPQIRLLVGPVTPWNTDQDGTILEGHNLPWLNYMNTLVGHFDEETKAKQKVGFALAGPDGFAVQSPGRPEAPEVRAHPAQEPLTDLHKAAWANAQAGFRVYRDWLGIINAYETTRNLPVYITSTNTFTSDQQIAPAQNYPPGWLTAAFGAINSEPQIQALCWFTELPYDKWADFSLKLRLNNNKSADAEFDQLLH